MQVQKAGESVRLSLTPEEARLLRYALERASFIDTPVAEQPRIQEFCAQALEALAATR